MELLIYIKELLLLNDCVIIPGFGGFVTNYKQAGLHAERFSAPGKSVSFNKKLNFNDGLLINHVASAEGLSYIAARKKIDSMVQELNYRLTDGEEIVIQGLGQLSYDEQQHLVFVPKLNDNLNLDAFGLPSFNYETLFSKQVARKAVSQQDREAVEVVFNKRKLKTLLVGVPLLVALAVFPLKNNLMVQFQKSDMSGLSEVITSTPIPFETESILLDETLDENISEEEPAAEIETIVEITPLAPESSRYFLIVGSFKNVENADIFLHELSDKGLEGTNLGVIRGLHYISLGGYATIDDALSARANYMDVCDCSGAWIYKKQ